MKFNRPTRYDGSQKGKESNIRRGDRAEEEKVSLTIMICSFSCDRGERQNVAYFLKMVPRSKPLKNIRPKTFRKPAADVLTHLSLSPFLTHSITSLNAAQSLIGSHPHLPDSVFLLSGAILTLDALPSQRLRHALVRHRALGTSRVFTWVFRLMEQDRYEILCDCARIRRQYLQRENAEFHQRLMGRSSQVHTALGQHQLTLVRMPKRGGRVSLRQDTHGGLRLPRTVFEDNEVGCWLLHQLGWTVEEEFSRLVGGCVAGLGKHIRGQVKSVATLLAESDSPTARAPTALANADVLRAAVVTETPRHLVAVYHALVAQFGQDFLVDIENSFLYSEAETVSVDGFRCIVLSFRIRFDTPLSEFVERVQAASRQAYGPGQHQLYSIDKALSSLTPLHRKQGVVLLGQVQLMLQHHYVRRELAHWIQQLVACSSPTLYADTLASRFPE